MRARYTGSNTVHEWLLFFSIVLLVVLYNTGSFRRVEHKCAVIKLCNFVFGVMQQGGEDRSVDGKR
jgi:hypothetical protein